MDNEDNENATKRKDISFIILNAKRNHYKSKDLISLLMKIDDKEYNLSFLVGDHDVLFFPEFKKVDAYSGGFKVIYDFLKSIKEKIGYFSSKFCDNSSEYSIETYKKEWWMSSENEIENENKFNKWVKENSEYLIQYDFSRFKEEEIEEVMSYLEIRDKFAKPSFIKVYLEGEKVNLNEELKIAVRQEDYKKAIEIREKLKNT